MRFALRPAQRFQILIERSFIKPWGSLKKHSYCYFSCIRDYEKRNKFVILNKKIIWKQLSATLKPYQASIEVLFWLLEFHFFGF
jgi:hypothetical protein